MRMLGETKLAINNIYDRIVFKSQPEAVQQQQQHGIILGLNGAIFGSGTSHNIPTSNNNYLNSMNSNGFSFLHHNANIPNASAYHTSISTANSNMNGAHQNNSNHGHNTSGNPTIAGSDAIFRHSTVPGTASQGLQTMGQNHAADNSAKSLSEKLHAIQERILDLQCK